MVLFNEYKARELQSAHRHNFISLVANGQYLSHELVTEQGIANQQYVGLSIETATKRASQYLPVCPHVYLLVY
jgi:hypothetical protein